MPPTTVCSARDRTESLRLNGAPNPAATHVGELLLSHADPTQRALRSPPTVRLRRLPPLHSAFCPHVSRSTNTSPNGEGTVGESHWERPEVDERPTQPQYGEERRAQKKANIAENNMVLQPATDMGSYCLAVSSVSPPSRRHATGQHSFVGTYAASTDIRYIQQ